jgi:hypothetical protein
MVSFPAAYTSVLPNAITADLNSWQSLLQQISTVGNQFYNQYSEYREFAGVGWGGLTRFFPE